MASVSRSIGKPLTFPRRLRYMLTAKILAAPSSRCMGTAGWYRECIESGIIHITNSMATFGSSGSWGSGPRQAEFRSRRLQNVAAGTAAQLETKFDKAGGDVSGNIIVSGDVRAEGAVQTATSFTSISDSSTGLRFPSDSQFALVQNDVPKISALSDGKLGFGTTVPSAPYEFVTSIPLTYNPAADNRGGRCLTVFNIARGTTGAFSSIMLQAEGPHVGVAQALISCVATGVSAQGELTFATRGQTGATALEKMRITWDGRVGIGVTAPDSSAQLDVTSTSRGFLPPRMTAAQANAIASKAEGLMVYVTNTGGSPFNFTAKGWWGWDGAEWKQMA